MGWFKCTKCGSEDWGVFEGEEGCDICNKYLREDWLINPNRNPLP